MTNSIVSTGPIATSFGFVPVNVLSCTGGPLVRHTDLI